MGVPPATPQDAMGARVKPASAPSILIAASFPGMNSVSTNARPIAVDAEAAEVPMALPTAAHPLIIRDVWIAYAKPVSAIRTPIVVAVPGTTSALRNARIAVDVARVFRALPMAVPLPMARVAATVLAKNAPAKRTHFVVKTLGIKPV